MQGFEFQLNHGTAFCVLKMLSGPLFCVLSTLPLYSSRPSGTMSSRASPLHATPFYSSPNTQGEQVDGGVINPFFAPRKLSNAPGTPLASSAAASSPFYLDLPSDVDMSARELSPSPSANVAASAASPFFAHGLGAASARPEVAASAEEMVVEHAQRRSIFFPAGSTSALTSTSTVEGHEDSATSMPQWRLFFRGFMEWARHLPDQKLPGYL
jgi:hypothetical protein